MEVNKPSTASPFTRREFLGASLATTAALTTLPAASLRAQPPIGEPVGWTGRLPPLPFNPRTAAAMPMRNLGKTGFRVGIFSLGCQAAIEIKGNEKLSVDIMNRAIDLGVNYFDTSNVYGGGVSEEHVGLVMRCATNFVPLSDSQMRALEARTLPIVRQALYFRRWDLGA